MTGAGVGNNTEATGKWRLVTQCRRTAIRET